MYWRDHVFISDGAVDLGSISFFLVSQRSTSDTSFQGDLDSAAPS